MKKYFDGLAVLLASAWVGGMWAAGYIAVPLLFQSLPNKALAGMLAGKLFAVTAYLGVLCAVYLLAYYSALRGKQLVSASLLWVIAAMLLLTVVGHFGLQPLLAEIKAQALPLYVMDRPYADRFRLWHGVSSIAYLLQSLLGAVLLLKIYSSKKLQD
jgi:hypothetical protein